MRIAVLNLLVIVLVVLPLSSQTPTWRVDPIASQLPVGTTGAFAVAVNDDGVVVGNAFLAGFKRAWLGSPASPMQILPLPAATIESEVYDINSFGVAVGRVYLTGNVSRGIVWSPATNGYLFNLVPAGPGGTLPFDARGINDRGDVVGKYGIFSSSYVWNIPNGTTEITAAVLPVIAEDINNERKIVGGTYRLDLDTMILENLGNPTGTNYNYLFTVLDLINDAGQCAGYGNTASSLSQNKVALRYTDGPVWLEIKTIPVTSAKVTGLSEWGDCGFQLGTFGRYVWVDGVGSIPMSALPGAAYTDWDLSASFAPVMSRKARIACSGINTATGQSGLLVLTPLPFEDLGGASMGTRGEPVLGAFGVLSPGSPVRYRLAAAASNSWVYYLVASNPSPLGIFGGTLEAYPYDSLHAVLTDTLGRHEAVVPWPAVPAGSTFTIQVVVVDSSDFSVSLSNAIRGQGL